MDIKASVVKELREMTGVGMMDCKKALIEVGGDMEKAVEYLRERGLAAAAKKAGRIAAEGMVECYADTDGTSVVIEVNSETDFVAKNDDFRAFVTGCAKTVAAQNPADVDALLAMKFEGGDSTVEQELQNKILTIGENIKIRRFERTTNPAASYIHGGGKIGVLCEFEVDGKINDLAAFDEMGKDICMQIAAMFPKFLDRASVPASVIEEEKAILLAQIKNDEKNANKPENIVEKMVEGRIGKFFTQNCLLEQTFVKDDSMTVGQYIEHKAKELGVGLKAINFIRMERGEGLEKRSDNFADEVQGMVQ